MYLPIWDVDLNVLNQCQLPVDACCTCVSVDACCTCVSLDACYTCVSLDACCTCVSVNACFTCVSLNACCTCVSLDACYTCVSVDACCTCVSVDACCTCVRQSVIQNVVKQITSCNIQNYKIASGNENVYLVWSYAICKGHATFALAWIASYLLLLIPILGDRTRRLYHFSSLRLPTSQVHGFS